MNDILKSTLDDFNKNNPDPCWYFLEEMKPWAGSTPCRPKPGERCPACGKHWDIRLNSH